MNLTPGIRTVYLCEECCHMTKGFTTYTNNEAIHVYQYDQPMLW